MTRPNGWTSYEQRLGRVMAYIYDHLDEDIDLNKLAVIACLSPYHWHRIYHAVHGETIAATVKRLRLHRAASYLASTSMSIAEIAEKSGYGSVQSFNRIFKAAYGMPPAQYRREGSHTRFHTQSKERINMMYDIAVLTVPSLKLAGVEHVGSYMNIGRAFETLYGWLAACNRFRPGMRSIGIYYDDATSVPEEKLRSQACITIDDDFVIESPLKPAWIAGGPCAVLKYKGPYADMKAAYQWLYGT